MRLCLLVSVAFNLLLLAGIVAARVDPSVPNLLAGAGEAVPPALGPLGPASGDADALLAALRTAGLAEADIKPMLAGWLRARARAKLEAPAPAYWQPEFAPAAAALAAELAIDAAVQDGLLALYGAAAAADPVFAPSFRPLGPAFAFLSPAEQRALRRYQLTQAREPAAPRAAVEGECTRAPVPAANAAAPPRDALASVLSGGSYEEYRLRFSPLAANLRQAAVAADEAEFRELFALLRQLELASVPAVQLELRKQLRARLGAAAFARLWSSFDPLYRTLADYLAGEGFAAGEIAAAYAVGNRRQEAMLALMSRGADQSVLLQALARHQAEEQAELSRLLGEEAARGLAAAMTAAAMRLGTAAGTDCPPALDSQ